jgi:hypothetical protein
LCEEAATLAAEIVYETSIRADDGNHPHYDTGISQR